MLLRPFWSCWLLPLIRPCCLVIAYNSSARGSSGSDIALLLLGPQAPVVRCEIFCVNTACPSSCSDDDGFRWFPLKHPDRGRSYLSSSVD
uniref:Putative secreted protein n=1 Tax=Anopheles darlingi TaxID=43151 RepID=A0A2M4D6C2_ANODA